MCEKCFPYRVITPFLRDSCSHIFCFYATFFKSESENCKSMSSLEKNRGSFLISIYHGLQSRLESEESTHSEDFAMLNAYCHYLGQVFVTFTP